VLPNLSLSVFERVFPRTFLLLRESEKARLARELLGAGLVDDLPALPAALAERKWERSRGFAPDLAWLEYYLRLASLAPEIEARGFDGVGGAGEPEWYGARFRFDPGHRLFESDWPLEEVFARPLEAHERSPGTFLIYRTQGRPHVRALGRNEEALLRSLSLGVPLGRVLERPNAPDFDARLFQRWVESGLLRAIDWAPV
jgi:hypothetical protein